MIDHEVRVYRSAERLGREDQLAWKIAAVAADPVEVTDDVTEMAINRVVDNAAVAAASLARRPVAAARDQALAELATARRDAERDARIRTDLRTERDALREDIRTERAEALRLRQSADADTQRLRAEASAELDRLRAEASAEAARLRAEAAAEVERIRTETDTRLEAERHAATERLAVISEARAEARTRAERAERQADDLAAELRTLRTPTPPGP
ncbi:hypothetical protein [Frankia sp. AiPs1]|uniref:hypothetical protein n=1 Tax=Frankia sp. AiPs1 TaxID=573493 RepID=UPI0035AC2026